MDGDPLYPRPLSRRDARVLVGLLAVLETHGLAGELDPLLADRLSERFTAEGLLTAGADERGFRQAVNDLNHRLRYVLGEYEEPPEPVPVPPARSR